MAKKTKWGARWAAKRGIVRHSSPKPIIIRPTPVKMVKPRSSKMRRHVGGGGGLGGIFSARRTQLMMGAFAVGVLEKQGIFQQLPALPFIGRTGTIGVAAHMFAGGHGGLAEDIATAAFIIAAHELGATGSIVGGDETDAHIGYVAGY